MSADFWAGYLSGAISIIIGNPLDVLKVRLQSSSRPTPTPTPQTTTTGPHSYTRPFFLGTAAPILGYGALNALLFVSYNRSLSLLSPSSVTPPPLTSIFAAGCISALPPFLLSTPIELIKCRAQLSTLPSLTITRQILRTAGPRGFYFGGTVTALRDSIGYGFYFWGYEVAMRGMKATGWESETGRTLVAGGVAGVVTWASVFPLDVVKTRVQTQGFAPGEVGIGEGRALLGGVEREGKRIGAWEMARRTYAEGGWRVFWRGLGVCSARAFVVNAVQWGVYEWVMRRLGEGRR